MKPQTWLAIGLVTVLGLGSVQLYQTQSRLEQMERRFVEAESGAGRASRRTSDRSGTSSSPSVRPAGGQSLNEQLTSTQQLRKQIRELRKEVDALKEARQIAAAQPTPYPRTPGANRLEHWSGGPKREWGHEQAAGPPNTEIAGDQISAWAPQAQNGGEEWLTLDYDDAVDIDQINIVESYNPGAISKVAAVLPSGEEVVVWEGTVPLQETDAVITSEFPIAEAVKSNQVKIYLDTTRVNGWNEIDAVQLVGGDGSKQWANGSSASSSYADN